MTLSRIQFASAAHLVVPKSVMERELADVRDKVKGHGEANQREWRQEFPFDNRYDEVVLLSGKDLNRAEDKGPINGFVDALGWATASMRTDFGKSPADRGFQKLTGRTYNQGIAVKALHQPGTL